MTVTSPMIGESSPRESASEPRPVATRSCTWSSGTSASMAATRSMSLSPLLSFDCFSSAAESIRSAFSSSGVRSGRCWSIRAAAPETTAVACEVPDPRNSRSSSATRPPGASTSMREPGTRRLITESPGASRSTLRSPSPDGDHFDVRHLPFSRSSALETEITVGLFAGLASRCAPRPSLPPATTTTMPWSQAFSIAFDSGSSSADCSLVVVYDRLSTRMLRPSWSRCWTTQSIAAITWVTSAAPVLSPTLRLMMRASGATPMRSPGCGSSGSAPGVRAAMMPAMWVP